MYIFIIKKVLDINVREYPRYASADSVSARKRGEDLIGLG